MVLRLSRFGSGFRERVDRVRVFWSAQRGARIAVPRCSRVYIWSAKTRRLSVRVHQNQTLRSTLLTMQGGYGPLSLWQQHRCSSWRQTQCKDGLISSRQQQQQRTSLRQGHGNLRPPSLSRILSAPSGPLEPTAMASRWFRQKRRHTLASHSLR